MLRWCLLIALAGCPAPQHYLIADVVSRDLPVDDALVAIDCGLADTAAVRTDERGRARVGVSAPDPLGCAVIVAKPGFATLRAAVASLCTAPFACPAMLFDLVPR